MTKNLVYLNHASIAPLCPPAAEAMRWLATDVEHFGSLHYMDWLKVYDGVRSMTASLINCAPGEIAIVKNTSEGIATIANGIEWRAGDRIVAFTEEFAANFFPWKHLEQRGVQVTWLSIFDDLNKVDEACRGARLLAVSFVQYLSGFRADLVRMGEICARHNCLFLVDAIQGLGAFPVDVRAANIDFLPPTDTSGCWDRRAAGCCLCGPNGYRKLRPRRLAGPTPRNSPTMRPAI